MLTVKPYLQTRRPSPTTVEYTITTCPPATLSIRLLVALTHVLRLVLALGILILLHVKYLVVFCSNASAASSPLSTAISSTFPPLLRTIYTHPLLSPTLHHLLEHLPIPLLLPLSLLALRLLIHPLHTTESLLVIRGLGIQTTSSATTYLSTAQTRFIPTDKIQDLYLNEAFRHFAVRYYLGVVVRGEPSVVVVFPTLLPGRKVLEGVWRGARSGLWDLGRGKDKHKDREGEGKIGVDSRS